MTSFLTTGGIRGGSEKLNSFQPRSFNMGISKEAFEQSKGFGRMHPGEDPDLTLRLWQLGFKSRLFKNSFVFHKRRIGWDKFKTQVSKFGKARPILDEKFPGYRKSIFWLPTVFSIGFCFSILLLFFHFIVPILFYVLYFAVILLFSSIQNQSFKIGILALKAVLIQFFYYGLSFLKSFIKIRILKIPAEKAFPELFFKKTKPILVGLTGGIGSGKTTVSKYLMVLGIPVFNSDEEAKKVMLEPEIILQIQAVFGTQVLDENNQINRKMLASIVFNNPNYLNQLNQIVHPAVQKSFDLWLKTHSDNPILFKEAAILFESGSYKNCDYVVSISASIATRVQRVMARDGVSQSAVYDRIQNQLTDQERAIKSDFELINDENSDYKVQMNLILKTINL